MQYERNNNGRPEGGFTFVELAMGIVVLVIGSIVLINHLSTSYSTIRHQKDRVFAFNKAQAILSEIQSYVDRGAISAAIELDALDDGVINKPTLTITESGGSLVLPNHPLSENYQRNSTWVWWRRITVQPFQGLNNRDVRYVTVRIYKKSQTGVDRVVASLSSVVSSAGSAFPTTQVFDVYLLAVENIPGWWVFMEAVIPFVESAITDLESRNPGLELRTHWITKASYGRNQMYRPYINDAVDSQQAAFARNFEPWLREQFQKNVSYDKMARELISARAAFGQNSPGSFLIAVGNKPEPAAAEITRIFLGARIGCAQCHDHPFAKWKQRDFWGTAAFFTDMNRSSQQLRGSSPKIRPQDEETYYNASFLDGSKFEASKDRAPREMLADWLVRQPDFSVTCVNRVWQHFFARGLVHPVVCASHNSRRLWGRMRVDMPTAMPSQPSINSTGSFTGRTTGSLLRPS